MTEQKIKLARCLRKAMTEPERLLWDRLKTRESGIVWKRQHPIGPYVLDFYCYRARLAVEIDGSLHDSDKDARRDAYFAKLDIETYRVPAADVYANADEVADGIWFTAAEKLKR